MYRIMSKKQYSIGKIKIPLLRGGKFEEFAGVACFDWQKRSLFPYWNLPKNKQLIKKARKLREQSILSEVIFWNIFKNKSVIKNYDIDRQTVIGNFIVDFFIARLGLVIEIDGSSHDLKEQYDKKREATLNDLGLKVLRYRNSEVCQNIEYVHQDLLENIEIREKELQTLLN